jgi:hypothetical protein
MFIMYGMACVWPRQDDYNPADLPVEYHPAVLDYFRRAASKSIRSAELTPDKGKLRIATAVQRRGLRERIEEAASTAYMFWLENRTKRIPRGAHMSALCGVRRFMERSGWQGRTGQRRASRRTVTGERLAMRERLRERHNPTPESVAIAVERIARTPKHAGKAYRIAKSLGLPGVRELVREACGFSPE